MSEAVIVAIVSGACTLMGSLLGVVAAGKLTNHRLQELEKKVSELTEKLASGAFVQAAPAKKEKASVGSPGHQSIRH